MYFLFYFLYSEIEMYAEIYLPRPAFEKFAKNVNGSIVFLIFTRIFAKIIVVCLKIFFLFRILDLDGEMVFGRWNHRRLGSVASFLSNDYQTLKMPFQFELAMEELSEQFSNLKI